MNTPRPPDSLGVPGTGRTASAAPEPHRPPAGATRPGRPAPTTGELGRTGLVAMLLCTALPLVDTYVVNVALAEIGRDLHTGPALLELVVAGYSIAHAVGLVPGGRLGDAHGRRTLLLAGLTAFGLSSLACGLAPTAGTLVAARVVQGMTAALMLPQVLATLQATTTGARRGRAISLYAGVGGLALVTGQILGGLILTADPGAPAGAPSSW